jgi:hypothetical protein
VYPDEKNVPSYDSFGDKKELTTLSSFQLFEHL